MKRREKNVRTDVEAHLELCSSPPEQEMAHAEERAMRRLRSEPASAVRAPAEPTAHIHPAWRWRLALVGAASAAALVVVMQAPAIRTFIWGIDAHAVVEAADGGLYRVSGGSAVQAGERIEASEAVRSNGGSGATLALADGSHIEMRAKSELLLERAKDGVRIRLNSGSVIVNAARQRRGHLYVQTKDVTVSVVGTVFLVNAEEEGSRVAVIEGEVRVQQGETEKKLLSGEQVATNTSMLSSPVKEEISWSRNAKAHLALLEQPAVARQKSTDPREAFEEVVVRPGNSTGGGGRGTGGSSCVGLAQIDPVRFAVNNTTLYSLIAWAYGKDCLVMEPEFISGGPGWVRSDRFNIEARLPEGSPSYTTAQLRSGAAPKLQMMLQTMLADRFKLALNHETKETPVYLLTAPRGTSKLKASTGEDESRLSLSGQKNQNGEEYAQLSGVKVSMARLANALSWSAATGRLVLDRTGITGEFNLDLQFAPQSQAFLDNVARQTGASANFVGPSLFTAIEEKLGLKLEGARAPVEFLVIEYVEKPSAEN